MIPQASITSWRAVAPWADDAQVEQDLVMSRAIVELFSDPHVAGRIAFRGGTCLNKLFIHPPARYSEDIDLVQTEPQRIGPLLDAVRQHLDPWLGKPARTRAVGGGALVYRFSSEIAPVRQLKLKVEINTREHFSVLGLQRRRLSVENSWFTGAADANTYQLPELLGTKLRALYQRRKGRDLFDLWFCVSRDMVDCAEVVRCFVEYMRRENHPVSRAEFEKNLHEKQNNRAFLEDIRPLLVSGIKYDPGQALKLVQDALIEHIPGEAWRGHGKTG